MFPTDFRVDVETATSTEASVRVQYGQHSKPDPAIRPWPAAPDRPFQSPDIEVRNARNAADAAWLNVPWADHDNTVVAKVANVGTLDAAGVEVEFFEVDFNLGGTPPEKSLGTDKQNVPSGKTVEFSRPWKPGSGLLHHRPDQAVSDAGQSASARD
jgi:hypothetical protein